MKRYLLTILTIIPLLGNSQTVTLPAWVVDSLIYNATQAKYYDTLVSKLDNQLAKQGAELATNQNALRMQTRQLLTADSLLRGKDKEILLVQERGEMLLKDEKKKSRRFKIAAVVEIVIILILL